MFAASSAAGTTPLSVSKFLLFLCFGQLLIATLNVIEVHAEPKDPKPSKPEESLNITTVPGYDVHTLDKYWSFEGNDSQCTFVWPGKEKELEFELLDSCVELCNSNVECKAFLTYISHKGKTVCGYFLNCPTPVPEPDMSGKNVFGYSKKYHVVHREKFLGSFGNIWWDNECQWLENHREVTHAECKALCLKNMTTCTAINYNEDGGRCVLRGCNPIPRPTSVTNGFQGYALSSAMYTGPFEKVWSDCQCPPLRNYHDKSLTECETLCVNDAKCTAINFSEDDCFLRACPNPVPPPKMIHPPFQGYAITAETKQCGTSRRCSRNNGECISKINWDSCDGSLKKRWCEGNQCACCVPQ